jgi:hexosaminidase
MAYPRGAAVAEVGWTPIAQRNYENFLQRLQRIRKHYDVMGVNYSRVALD